MFKLCLVSPVPPPYGGIANWTKMILPALPEYGITVNVINTAPSKRSTEGRNILNRVFGGGFMMLKHLKSLRRLIKTDRPDAIHITTSGRLAIIRDILLLKEAKRRKIPAVYHIRFGRIPEIASRKTMEWLLFRKAVRLAYTTVAIDQKTFSCLQKNMPGCRAVCIPNPVDVSGIPTLTKKKKEILFVGWIVKGKGIEELLQTWCSISSDFPDYSLRIIGPGLSEYVSCLKRNFGSGNVCFEGEQPHDYVLQAMAQAPVFALPSYSEGFPNAVVEAMTAGMTVVASRVGAVPEMLSDDCGILVEPGNAQSLSEGLRKAISAVEAGEKIGENARRKAVRYYALDVVLNQYINLWKCGSNVPERKTH